jgi:hypothetical protein
MSGAADTSSSPAWKLLSLQRGCIDNVESVAARTTRTTRGLRLSICFCLRFGRPAQLALAFKALRIHPIPSSWQIHPGSCSHQRGSNRYSIPTPNLFKPCMLHPAAACQHSQPRLHRSESVRWITSVRRHLPTFPLGRVSACQDPWLKKHARLPGSMHVQRAILGLTCVGRARDGMQRSSVHVLEWIAWILRERALLERAVQYRKCIISCIALRPQIKDFVHACEPVDVLSLTYG